MKFAWFVFYWWFKADGNFGPGNTRIYTDFEAAVSVDQIRTLEAIVKETIVAKENFQPSVRVMAVSFSRLPADDITLGTKGDSAQSAQPGLRRLK